MQIDPLMTRSPLTGALRHVTTDLLAEVYLAPSQQKIDFANLLKNRPAPWSESLDVAPAATLRAIERALSDVMRSTHNLSPDNIDTTSLPEGRAKKHLSSLVELWCETNYMPRELQVWRHVLMSGAEDALESLPIVGDAPCPFAAPAEAALRARLADHHGTVPAEKQIPFAASSLGSLQESLGRDARKTVPDESVRIFGLRDPNEEAQMAAAQAQSLLETGVVDAASEIGVLVPGDSNISALIAAFERVGLQLSGLPSEPASRDHVSEILLAFLAGLRAPAPRSALATISSSPLMPWTAALGRQLARDFIQSGWSRAVKQMDDGQRKILQDLRPVSNATQLRAKLLAISESISNPDVTARVRELLMAVSDPIDWTALHLLSEPRSLELPARDRFIEGISLFSGNALPWRSVRHLVVLGMSGDNWPPSPKSSPFFTEAETDLIRNETSLMLPDRRQRLGRGLELFRRQLCMTTDGATLLLSARDISGKPLAPSTALSLITHMLGGNESADILTDIRRIAPSQWPVSHEIVTPLENGGAPIVPATGVIDLSNNLLQTRQEKDGSPARQSPSRLESLIVSPLAWLLEELDARDRTWMPEAFDVLTMGSIQHAMLEEIFRAGFPIPEDQEITAQLDGALAVAIRKEARWLEGEDWSVERASLWREALSIAQNWGQFLRDSGAEILANEGHLKGWFNGLLIGGRVDSILRLPDNRILVIDHKRSRSTSRRERMEKGWDLQVALYKAMLTNPFDGSVQSKLVPPEAQTVTAYHTMLDATVLTNPDGRGIQGAGVLQNDISENALAELENAVTEVAGGRVLLNREDDAKRFQKDRGITTYALNNNPLVAAFLVPADEAADG